MDVDEYSDYPHNSAASFISRLIYELYKLDPDGTGTCKDVLKELNTIEEDLRRVERFSCDDDSGPKSVARVATQRNAFQGFKPTLDAKIEKLFTYNQKWTGG
ncbi:MAG: hypothetical protein EXS55_01100 [Candidatus Magasanikbacteria bacterium]|nr:hypothetical protein [Candidatus Magasanikbacteria bacterium]